MEYKIRRAIKSDSKKLDHLLTNLIQDEKKYDNNINELCVVNCFFENVVDDKNTCVLVAETYSKEIVAYLFGFILNNGDAYIGKTVQLDSMYVKENCRKNKIGDKLILEFQKWAKDVSAKYIELKVLKNNDAAYKLYIKNDFYDLKIIMRMEL